MRSNGAHVAVFHRISENITVVISIVFGSCMKTAFQYKSRVCNVGT